MQGLINTIEAARRQFGESARVYVDGFEIDDQGRPITLPWRRPRQTWLGARIAEIRHQKELDDSKEDFYRIEALRR